MNYNNPVEKYYLNAGEENIIITNYVRIQFFFRTAEV